MTNQNPSTALLDAQQRLQKYRERDGIAIRPATQRAATSSNAPDSHSWALHNGQVYLQQQRERAGIRYRPSIPVGDVFHDGVDKAPLPTPPAPTHDPERKSCAVPAETNETRGAVFTVNFADPSPDVRTITQHGEMAMAALRSGESAHYQLWLILRYLDETGVGYVSWQTAVNTLSQKSSPRFLYNPERLRRLRAEGNGRYWTFQTGRFWYYNPARVSFNLVGKRLSGHFTHFTGDHLFTNGIATFRAHCFASWLANHPHPLSRQTIEKLTGITERTQRRYCVLTDIEVQENLAFGPPVQQTDPHEVGWGHQGQGVFEFTDFQGQQGPAQRRYWAWHLPNRYTVSLSTTGRRRCRRHNHALLITQPAGNVECQRPRRIFFDNGKAAAKAFSRHQEVVYWQRTQSRTGRGLWHELV